MFKKIVSNLPYSPAMLGQLGFYAKRVGSEQATRRVGLIFTALALIVQSFIFISPPEAAQAANDNNMIYNGVRTKEDLLNAWDRNNDGKNHKDIQQIFKFFLGEDFSRSDLEKTQLSQFGSRDKINNGRLVNVARQPKTIDSQQKAFSINDADGNSETIWMRHLDVFDTGANRSGRGSFYDAFIGNFKGTWFAIMLNCGNLVVSDNDLPKPITPVLTVEATCNSLFGFAYNESNVSSKVKLLIYLDDGSGETRYDTVANLTSPQISEAQNNYFSFNIPENYKGKENLSFRVITSPTTNLEQAKELKGVINTSECIEQEEYLTCDSLMIQNLGQNRYRFTTNSSSKGHDIIRYKYVIKTSNGDIISENSFESSENQHKTDEIEVTEDKFIVTSQVLSSDGQISEDCLQEYTATCEENNNCPPNLIVLKKATNITKDLENANSTKADPGDRITYTIFLENLGSEEITKNISENLSDVLEYADLSDMSGELNNVFNQETKTFHWNDIKLQPGESFQREITVQVKQNIPATPQSVSNPESYDCKMSNTFLGSDSEISVNCPGEKIIEESVKELPATGPTTNIIFGSVLLMVVTYFYARARQLRKESKIIRKEYNQGVI